MLPETPRPPARSRLRLSKALPTPPQPPGNPKEQEILSTANSTPLASPATVRAMLAVTADQIKLVGLSSNPRKTSHESPSIEADIPELRNSTGSSESESDSPSTPNPPPASYLDQPLPKLPMGLPAISNLIDDKSSSTQQELWRRREEKKKKTTTSSGQQKTSFWNLGLRKSNGSTAQAKQPSSTATSNLPPKPPPRTLSARKPVPVRPAPPQPDSSMGNQISKMKERKSNSSTTSKDEVLPTFSTFKRLPTPDQLQKPPPQPQSQPPRTSSLPQHSKEPPQDEELTPKILPTSSNSRSSTPLANTTNRPAPTGTFPSSHTRDSSSATITSSSSQHPPALEAPQPSHPFTMRLLTPPLPPQTASSSSSTTLVSTSAPAHAHASTHSKGHIRFPSSSSKPLPAHDAILAAPPLGPLHWSCYQKHAFMRRGRNEVCAVACMVCQVRDREARWRCPWCCLSACKACMDVLAVVPGRELRGVVERAGRGGDLGSGSG